MPIISEQNISMRNVKNVLKEKANDLWSICHSPRINKWARYSPLTEGGTNISFRNLPTHTPWDQLIWEHTPSQVNEAKLGDFRNYNHAAFAPMSGGFPAELYKNINNMFMVGIVPDGGTIISTNDVFNTNELHFGVAVRKKNDPSMYFWGTNPQKGSSSVTLDLKPFGAFPTGTIVEVCLFYASAHKEAMDPDVINDYYSIRADENVVWIKEYTIKNYIPPVDWETLTIKYEPMIANWDWDLVWFDDIWVEITSKISKDFQFGIRIVTPDERYYTDFSMLRPQYVEAGKLTRLVNTGHIELPLYQDYNIVFIQVFDKLNSNKIIAEIPVAKFIEQ